MKITSFGYKHRRPPRADQIIDCRNLPNPHNVKALKPLTGRDMEVRQWLHEPIMAFIEPILAGPIPDTVACGCIGGRHRSVAVAEALALNYRSMGYTVEVEHLEL